MSVEWVALDGITCICMVGVGGVERNQLFIRMVRVGGVGVSHLHLDGTPQRVFVQIVSLGVREERVLRPLLQCVVYAV